MSLTLKIEIKNFEFKSINHRSLPPDLIAKVSKHSFSQIFLTIKLNFRLFFTQIYNERMPVAKKKLNKLLPIMMSVSGLYMLSLSNSEHTVVLATTKYTSYRCQSNLQ